MRRKLFLGVVFLASSAFGAAQSDSSQVYKKWTLSISLGNTPIPPMSLSIQPGIEYFFTPRVSLFTEISLQTGKNRIADSAALNKRFLKYKAEIRYLLVKELKPVTPYFAFQLATARRNFEIGKPGLYYEKKEDSVYRFDKVMVKSPYTTVTAQIGSNIRLYKELFMDISIGAGLRLVNTSYFSAINLQKDREPDGLFYIKPLSSYRYNGRVAKPQLNLWMRLFYCI